MGSCKWGYKSPNMGTIVTLLITPFITAHEPPSMITLSYYSARTRRELKYHCIRTRTVPITLWSILNAVTDARMTANTMTVTYRTKKITSVKDVLGRCRALPSLQPVSGQLDTVARSPVCAGFRTLYRTPS